MPILGSERGGIIGVEYVVYKDKSHDWIDTNASIHIFYRVNLFQ